MTYDRDSFIAGICESPADDLPRLVYADWLEEHGEADRAEFIRVQCALANSDSLCGLEFCVGRYWKHSGDERTYPTKCHVCAERLAALQARERELLQIVPLYPSGVFALSSPVFTRGFCSQVTMRRDELRYLPAILATQPIERITVEGVEFGITRRHESKWPWYVRANLESNSWPTRSALVAGLGEWIESVLPRHDGNINDADLSNLVASRR